MALGELVTAAFKNMNITDIIQLVQVQNLRGLYQRAMGIVKPSSSSSDDDGTKEAKEDGRGNNDEHNALVAMAEAHYGQDLLAMPKEENTITRGRFRKLMAIFKTLRAQGKTGGAEKLMHIIGHESHLHGQAVQRKEGTKKPDGQPPERIDIVNVRERTNPAGRLIIRFLTDLETQEAVDLLTSSSITDNGKDKTAAAAKAATDKAEEWRQRWKEYYGKHDTALHELAVYLVTDQETLRRITESERAKELRTAVEAAPEGEKRKRHEAYQLYLQEMVREFRSTPAVRATMAREARGKGFKLTTNMAIALLSLACIGLLIVLGILQGLRNHLN